MGDSDAPARPTRPVPWIPLTIGVVQVALLGVPLVVGATDTTALMVLIAGETLLLGGLGVTLVRSPYSGRAIVAYVIGLGLLLGVAVGGWQASGALWGGVLSLTIVAALVSYAIHRYQVVVTDLAHREGEPS